MEMEKGMAAHSSILAWRILWTEETGGPLESQRLEHHWATNTHTHTHTYTFTHKKNEIVPFAATCMDLESIKLIEVSQRKTNTIWSLLYT